MTTLITNAKISKTEKSVALKFGAEILFEGIEIRPTYYQGSGRRTSLYTSATEMAKIDFLTASGLFNVESGNDAARGSATGDYFRFTPKRKRLALKKALQNQSEQYRAEIIAAAENKINSVKQWASDNSEFLAASLQKLDQLKAEGNQQEWHKIANSLVQMACTEIGKDWKAIYNVLRG
ncbi:MAG: hypothetical protein VKM97_07205 [Cyanobacteriota bacterium]|nr:hypothetical protein [Cyanobacteriota bacterium]